MLALIEELVENEIVYILFDNCDRFLYGEYRVEKIEYKKLNQQSATLVLMNAPKKKRYFRKKILFKGFRINFAYTSKSYKVFDDFDDLTRYFCSKLIKEENGSLKLIRKFKKQHPNYFRFTTY